MKSEIEKLKSLCDELITIVQNFAPQKLSEKLFGNWTIKEMIDHISGWNVHTIGVMKNLKLNKLSDWGEETDEFNASSVSARTHLSWEQSLQEFINTSRQLVDEYNSLTPVQFNQRIYSEASHSHHTLQKFLQTDIDHYQEHLTVIQNI